MLCVYFYAIIMLIFCKTGKISKYSFATGQKGKNFLSHIPKLDFFLTSAFQNSWLKRHETFYSTFPP